VQAQRLAFNSSERANFGTLHGYADFCVVQYWSRATMARREERMVLTREELVSSLQNEVRILLHLAGKIDPAQLDYRPTPTQRSTIELLRYLSVMGPALIASIRSGVFDTTIWQAALADASRLTFDEALAAIGKQTRQYAALIGEFSDVDLRSEVQMFYRTGSRGSIIVNIVLCHHTAYRTQLFLYLKACGRDELGTANLWAGMDAAASS
jgi:hypothetical protein